jgi:SpoVK/Ycf46/Vps4 family AAA+-type ATPase
LPLLRPDLFLSDSGLVSPPKGILLYGPPGTGKTMLAKAIAKESHATFVNVQLSTIMNKWFGESNKLISAVFGLARKLAPSVVFIDEMDAFLSQRDGTEGSAVNSMKSEFLTLWDGLLSERPQKCSGGGGGDNDNNNNNNGTLSEATSSMMLPTPPIIVLGCTNRPYDVDPAILRRLPRSFEISLPNHNSRLQLLRLFLEKQHMTPEAKAFLPKVAEMTVGYSGSDLKEVCRAAAWEPVREMTSGASRKAVGWDGGGNKKKKQQQVNNPMLKRTSSGFPPRGTKARPVNKNDFILAVQKVKKTGESARDFHKKEFLRGRDEKMAMAADIRNTPVGGSGGGGGNGKGTKKSVKKATTIPQSTQPMQQIDIQEVMRVAMAAAASMNQGYVGESAVSSDEEDDDSPPEIFVDANS